MNFDEWDHYEFGGLTRQLAVEIFDRQIAWAELDKEGSIKLPVFVAKLILACAKAGQHKGQGRGRPPDSEKDRISKRAIEEMTRARGAELTTQGLKRSRAKDQAVEEVQAKFGRRTGRSAAYAKRKAHSKS